MNDKPRRLLEPFSSAARLVFTLLALGAVFGIGLTLFMEGGSFLGVGESFVCARPEVNFFGSRFEEGLGAYKEMLQPGVGLLVDRLQVCDHTPSLGQHVLVILTVAPTYLLYLAVFFLFFRLVGGVNESGPFNSLVVVRLRPLGWTLIAGGYLAHAVEDSAQTALENTLTRPGGSMHVSNWWVLLDGLLTVHPYTLLTGLGLVTIARIMQVGVRMHEDLAGTV